jgi:hypothetical protein
MGAAASNEGRGIPGAIPPGMILDVSGLGPERPGK